MSIPSSKRGALTRCHFCGKLVPDTRPLPTPQGDKPMCRDCIRAMVQDALATAIRLTDLVENNEVRND